MGDRVLALQDLKTYLKNVKDLEVICYQQKRLLNNLQQLPSIKKQELLELNQEAGSLETSLWSTKEINKPVGRIKSFFASLVFALLSSVIVGLISGGVALVIWLICKIFHNITPLGTFLKFGIIIGFVLTFVISLIAFFVSGVKIVKSAPDKLNDLDRQKQEVDVLIENKKKEIEEHIPAIISEAQKCYRLSKNALQMYYNAGVIYPKYRGIVPVTTIYEYIESGRCTVLEGHEGAYNLYENELRMNLIIGKLDDISSKLDQIADNQRLLVQEIRESNRKMDAISQSVYSSLDKLDEIGNNTELSAYYSRISASNTSYMAWLDFLNN